MSDIITPEQAHTLIASAMRDAVFRQSLLANPHAAIAALPGDAYVFQIGLMLARGLDMVRICIRDIAPEQVLDYLQRIGWPGRTDEIAPCSPPCRAW